MGKKHPKRSEPCHLWQSSKPRQGAGTASVFNRFGQKIPKMPLAQNNSIFMLSPSAIKKQLALFLLLSILGLSATEPHKTETEKVCKIERISVVSVDKSNRRDSAATVYHYGSNGRLDSTSTFVSGKSVEGFDAGTELFFYSPDGFLTKMIGNKNRNGDKVSFTATWEYDQNRVVKTASSEIHFNGEKLMYVTDIEREWDGDGNFTVFRSVTKHSSFTNTLHRFNKYKNGRLVEITTFNKDRADGKTETQLPFKLNDAGLVLEYKDKENNIKIVYEYNGYGEKTRQEFHKDGQMKNYEEWEYDDKKYINKIVQPMTMGG
ncbi:MAG: hypothetical protein MUD08_10760, partial [Cytophagales bacterium]|nr:hypothetical protein [Cytophagales bacterium]